MEGSGSYLDVSTPALSTLVVGMTGTGKTMFAKLYVKKLLGKARTRKSVVVVNGDIEDFPPESAIHMEWDDERLQDDGDADFFGNVRVIIWDDLSMPGQPQQKVLRHLLTKVKRHKDVHVIVIAHSIVVNGISHLAIQFDRILFTASGSNAISFESFVRSHARDIFEKRHLWEGFFKEDSPLKKYLSYNQSQRRLCVLDKNLKIPAREQAVQNQSVLEFAQKYLLPEGGRDRVNGLKLCEFLLESIGSQFLKGFRYEVLTRSSSGELSRPVSILDILAVASTPGAQPTPMEARVFQALTKHAPLPRCLVRNALLHEFL